MADSTLGDSTPVAIDGPETIARAVEAIRARFPRAPRVGVILGSGLAEVVESFRDRVDLSYSGIPGFARTTALGHAGNLVLGDIGGVPTVVMQGRFHLYEGHSTATVTLPVRVMHALGIEGLIITNASGGLDASYRPGDVMIIRDHLSMQWLDPVVVRDAHADGIRRAVYDEWLIACAESAARREAIDVKQGVYVGVVGPNYETRAEYRMFRRLGGSAVGMSTIAEAIVASRLGLHVLGLSMIANLASPDAPEKVTHEQVLLAVGQAADKVRRIVERLVAEWDSRPVVSDAGERRPSGCW